jgi:hypothetical protein
MKLFIGIISASDNQSVRYLDIGFIQTKTCCGAAFRSPPHPCIWLDFSETGEMGDLRTVSAIWLYSEVTRKRHRLLPTIKSISSVHQILKRLLKSIICISMIK